jgi:hypothetical protein
MTINAIGATATGIVLVIVAATKFVHGAWIVISAMPVIVLLFLGVHRHYRTVGQALRARQLGPAAGLANVFVLLVRDLELATTEAVSYLRALRPERVIPLYVGDPARYENVSARWSSVAPRVGELRQAEGAGGGVGRAVRGHVRALRDEDPERFVTVVIPEAVSGSLVGHLLSRRARFWLKLALLYEAGVVVTSVPLLPEEHAKAELQARRPVEPVRSVVVVPVSAVHAATARAVSYAMSLNAPETEAIFLVTDPGEEERVIEEWFDWRMAIPLSIVDAQFRDLTGPLLDEVRRHTAKRGTVVTVVLPEIVVSRWWEHLLHNQNALFIKRLLLFEPDVVVTSVPFHLSTRSATPPREASRADRAR